MISKRKDSNVERHNGSQNNIEACDDTTSGEHEEEENSSETEEASTGNETDDEASAATDITEDESEGEGCVNKTQDSADGEESVEDQPIDTVDRGRADAETESTNSSMVALDSPSADEPAQTDIPPAARVSRENAASQSGHSQSIASRPDRNQHRTETKRKISSFEKRKNKTAKGQQRTKLSYSVRSGEARG